MAPVPSRLAWFDDDGHRAKTVSPGQDIELDWSELLSQADCFKTAFSGRLTLHSAGSGMDDSFCLDTEDRRILITQRANLFYREMRVHVDGAPVGSYIDLGLGPYFKMNLKDASLDQMKALLRCIRFTVRGGPLLPGRPGPRVITAELQEQGSGQRSAAQTVVNVVAPPSRNPAGWRHHEQKL